MDTKHTPGPWKHASAYLSGNARIEAADGSHIASAIYGGAVSMKETAANARLIAAAPDLLEAGMAFAHAYEVCNTFLAPMEREAFDKLLAAISKATGNTSADL